MLSDSHSGPSVLYKKTSSLYDQMSIIQQENFKMPESEERNFELWRYIEQK
jgi:hypothetical protein